jgi:aminodeoxyfutalosine deaminase
VTLTDYIRAMPKVELHIHLEGSVQPETLFDLAQRHHIALPVSSVAELAAWYTFRDFNHFLDIFTIICQCLRAPEDFTRITYEYGQSMARQNIRYAEVTWTPYTHVCQFSDIPWSDLLAAIDAGREQAQQDFGVDMRWIPDIARCFTDTADPVVDWLLSDEAGAAGVVALGLGGPEVGYPPELFESAFEKARAGGLHSNPHAGETVGPESVWGAIRALKAERIGHGVRSIEDPALMAHLAEHQLPLEVNPTSNLCLRVYPSYQDHPLRRLIEAGVCVTINSDDPALFNTTLNDEYSHAVQDCGLSVSQLEQTALNAVRASYLPADEKQAMLATFEQEYVRLRHLYGIDGA